MHTSFTWMMLQLPRTNIIQMKDVCRLLQTFYLYSFNFLQSVVAFLVLLSIYHLHSTSRWKQQVQENLLVHRLYNNGQIMMLISCRSCRVDVILREMVINFRFFFFKCKLKFKFNFKFLKIWKSYFHNILSFYVW